MGIVTRLNFGQAGSPMNNYRFPTYITGVRQQSSDMTRYHITGAKHIKGKTINNNSQTWNLDYDETFCSDKVYIINGELYSNANKVLTTNSTLSSSNLNNNSVTFNGASASLGSSGTITPELVVDGNTIKSKVGNQTSTGITVPFATTAGTCTGNADTATRLAGNDTYTAWGRTYWENGQPKTIDGNLNNVDKIYFQKNSNDSRLYLDAYRSAFRDSNNTIIGYSDGLHLKKSSTIDNDVRYFAFEAYKDENTSRRESKILMFDTNIIDYEPNIANSGLSLGYGSRGIVTTNLSGKDISMWVYDPDSITANNNNPAKEVLKLVASTNETSGISAFQTYLPQATQASSGLRIGNAILYWDSQNDALALCKYNGTENPSPANFYATGGVSALGMSSGSGSVPAMAFGNLTVNSHLTLGTNATVNKLVMDGNISMHENMLKFATSNETESSITAYYEGGLDGIIINSDYDIVLNADHNYYIMDGSDVYRFNIGAAQTAGILTQI